MTWEPIEIKYEEISNFKHIIKKLIDGYTPALIIRNFYDKESCNTIVKRTRDITYHEHANGLIKKIGTFLLAYLNKKPDYFSDAENSRRIFRTIFEGIEDPRKKIHSLASVLFPKKDITVATEDGKKYSCGIIRIHENGDSAPIHRDNVRFEARNFSIAKFSKQLSCVLHLQQPENGGELVLHKQSWKKSDEKFRNIEFGYSPNVISNCKQSVKICAKQGDLVIINPIYYHEILPVKGSKTRVTLGLFLAFSNYGHKVVTWS